MLQAEASEHEAALTRPIAETEARLTRLRHALRDIDQSLSDLGFLFRAAESELARVFAAMRWDFVTTTLPDIRHRLRERVAGMGRTSERARFRTHAFDEARRLAETSVHAWLAGIEPEAERLYREATARFCHLSNEYLRRVKEEAGGTGTSTAPMFDEDAGFQERRRFYFTSLMTLTSPSPMAWLVDHVAPAPWRIRSVGRAADEYLLHLIDTNSHRVENDLRERVLESRRWLEGEIRNRLAAAVSSGERARAPASDP
jgi:hypothetical protein